MRKLICLFKNLTYRKFEKVGFWREEKNQSNNSIEIVRSFARAKYQVMDRLKRHLIVSTKLVSSK